MVATVSVLARRTAASGGIERHEQSGRGQRTKNSGGRRAFYDIAKGSTYEVISVLAIARRRREVDQSEFDSFYQAGDEIASIISGLIDATFREEATSTRSPRTVREEGIIYEAPDDYSNS